MSSYGRQSFLHSQRCSARRPSARFLVTAERVAALTRVRSPPSPRKTGPELLVAAFAACRRMMAIAEPPEPDARNTALPNGE